MVAFDSLHRRGSELFLPRLRAANVAFLHGDVRVAEDLAAAGPTELPADCAGEPGVHDGHIVSPSYMVGTNLVGLTNCLEHARRHGGDVIYLSRLASTPLVALWRFPAFAVPASR